MIAARYHSDGTSAPCFVLSKGCPTLGLQVHPISTTNFDHKVDFPAPCIVSTHVLCPLLLCETVARSLDLRIWGSSGTGFVSPISQPPKYSRAVPSDSLLWKWNMDEYGPLDDDVPLRIGWCNHFHLILMLSFPENLGTKSLARALS